jgi:hypothetical protein
MPFKRTGTVTCPPSSEAVPSIGRRLRERRHGGILRSTPVMIAANVLGLMKASGALHAVHRLHRAAHAAAAGPPVFTAACEMVRTIKR